MGKRTDPASRLMHRVEMSLSAVTTNQGSDYAQLRIEDRTSGIVLTEVKIPFDQLGRLLTNRQAKGEAVTMTQNMDRLGKHTWTHRETVMVKDVDDPKVVRRIKKLKEVEGWEEVNARKTNGGGITLIAWKWKDEPQENRPWMD